MNDEVQSADFDDDQQEIEIEAIGIEVSSQPIELYKVFKIANLVSGGGEAKHIIAEGYVAVNGEIETRKRRKMYDGDFFEFNQEYYVVLCDQPVTEPTTAKEKQPTEQAKPQGNSRAQSQRSGKHNDRGSKKTGQKPAQNQQDQEAATKSTRSGRKNIDFF
ncbi:RNA-binding S4 domain-containing protein [Vibrio sp.]|uniref:RNA-binding S4 domain-containing protein n=1 Tax=Vibrio sp. TaxID=678 RepID=UPI003D0CA44F